MIRQTAFAALIALPAQAQFIEALGEGELRASDVTGRAIHAVEGGTVERIGTIEDVIMDGTGAVRAVTLDLGGYLGTGRREVAIGADALILVPDPADPGLAVIAIDAGRGALEAAPAYRRAAPEPQATGVPVFGRIPQSEGKMDGLIVTTETTSPSGTAATPDPVRSGLVAPRIAREGFATEDLTTMDPQELLQVRVYDVTDERIGEVGEWILGPEGAVEAAVIDVGGFIGLGERQVAVEVAALTLLADADGNDMRIYVDATEEQLEALPEYD